MRPGYRVQAKGKAESLGEVTPRGLTGVDVADRVGIGRAMGQRYLFSLAHAESVRLELNNGSTGRPEHSYRPEIR